MSDEIVFYTNPMSRGRIAHWMLEEVGCAYRTVYLDFGAPMHTADYLALNPMGKVPTIVHGDTVVTEVPAICAYLADAFPDAGLAPEPGRRGAYYRWLFFAAGPLEAAVTNRALGIDVSDEQSRFVGYGGYERTLDALETAVSGGKYVAGDRFTAADLYLGAHIDFGLRFGGIESRPAFEAYRDRVVARPAAERARALDDAAMPKQEG